MAKAGVPRMRLDLPAFTQFLGEGVRPQLEAAGRRVQAGVPSNVPTDMRVTMNKKGRLAAVVTIVHPSGVSRQLKDGVLTGAAARNGLEVTRYRV